MLSHPPPRRHRKSSDIRCCYKGRWTERFRPSWQTMAAVVCHAGCQRIALAHQRKQLKGGGAWLPSRDASGVPLPCRPQSPARSPDRTTAPRRRRPLRRRGQNGSSAPSEPLAHPGPAGAPPGSMAHHGRPGACPARIGAPTPAHRPAPRPWRGMSRKAASSTAPSPPSSA